MRATLVVLVLAYVACGALHRVLAQPALEEKARTQARLSQQVSSYRDGSHEVSAERLGATRVRLSWADGRSLESCASAHMKRGFLCSHSTTLRWCGPC
jgi:hypothetical protein